MSEDEAIITPLDFIRYVAENRKIPMDTVKAPQRLLTTYQRSAYEYVKKLINGKPINWWTYGESQPFCIGQFNDVEIGLARFWVGAPAAVMTLEEIIVCGTKIVFEVGLSGGLQNFLKPSNIVVVTEAIRDEGTSYHYLPPKVKVESSTRLRDRLVRKLNRKNIEHFVGSVWSTDGVYRETHAKFRKFRKTGVLCVDMETSAIFAVAKYRNIEAASAQVISDILSETGWVQAWDHKSVREKSEALLRAVLEVLSES